jgi:hypothetical protein
MQDTSAASVTRGAESEDCPAGLTLAHRLDLTGPLNLVPIAGSAEVGTRYGPAVSTRPSYRHHFGDGLTFGGDRLATTSGGRSHFGHAGWRSSWRAWVMVIV